MPVAVILKHRGTGTRDHRATGVGDHRVPGARGHSTSRVRATGALGGTTKGIFALRRRLRPALLRWSVSVFCALLGALMLVVPHQFAGPSFAPLRPWLTEWGVAFFAAGVALIASSAVGMHGPLAIAS